MKRILILIIVAFALVGCEVVLSEAPSVPPFNTVTPRYVVPDSHVDTGGQVEGVREGCYPQESCTPVPTPTNPTPAPTATLQPNECQSPEQCLPAPTSIPVTVVCADGDTDCLVHQGGQ